MIDNFYSKFNIDISKLSRDYLINPLSRGELPNANDIKYLYLELNLFHKDVADYFNIVPRTFTKWLKSLNISKPNNLKRENINKSNIKKYGTNHIFQTALFQNKRKQTCLEKYGVEYSTQETNIKKKIHNAILEKYGVNHFKQTETPKSSLEILSNKDLLIDFINNQPYKNIMAISFALNIAHSTLRKYIDLYNLNDLINTYSFESTYEIELQKLYPFMIAHDRTILNGKEIDLYDETHKIGIEFNGNYWHNEFSKDKLYHQNKSLMAEKQGIFIYHIFEYEWINKRYQIINQLNNLLGLNQEKIYARKCVIKEVNNKEKSLFLQNNHLQGNDASSIKLGLYYNNELVSLMTLCKPRFNKKYEYELSRFCSKAGTNVIGGASKLWNYFIKTYNPSSVISYSNIAHTKGNLYQMLGMTLHSISEPNYVWCNHKEILSRYQCQKHKLLKQGYVGNTEEEIMTNRDYFRIYDCGNKVWVWNNKML